jgi:hypothetical protein
MTLLLIAGVGASALALILWGIVPLVARPALDWMARSRLPGR